ADAPEIFRMDRVRRAELDTAAVEVLLARNVADLAVAVAREQCDGLRHLLVDAESVPIAIAEAAAVVGPSPDAIVPLARAEVRDVLELRELEHRVGQRAELIARIRALLDR